jgi:hypothetical protein
MVRSVRFLLATLVAAFAGWLAIGAYLTIVRVILGDGPYVLFQWDASNLIGRAAFSEGLSAVALGLGLDYIVSLVWAAAALVAMQRYAAAARHPTGFGALFGAIVMGVMLFVVVPLGHAPRPHFTPPTFLNTLVAHTIFFGIPVAWVLALTTTTGRARRSA